jgi:hypothetical protein
MPAAGPHLKSYPFAHCGSPGRDQADRDARGADIAEADWSVTAERLRALACGLLKEAISSNWSKG